MPPLWRVGLARRDAPASGVAADRRVAGGRGAPAGRASAVPLREVAAAPVGRLSVGLAEVDRVLGGGLVPGALVLLGGEPGIGKSTLVLEIAAGRRCASATGDRPRALRHRRGVRGAAPPARRPAGPRRRAPRSDAVQVLAATDLGGILAAADALAPAAADRRLRPDPDQRRARGAGRLRGPGARGRCAAGRLGARARHRRWSWSATSPRTAASPGPRTLEHLVDVVLAARGRPLRRAAAAAHRQEPLRLDRGGRRAGDDRRGPARGAPTRPGRSWATSGARRPGVAVAAILEGTRPLLVEVQALVAAPAASACPVAPLAGLDANRLALLVAVLARRCGLNLAPERPVREPRGWRERRGARARPAARARARLVRIATGRSRPALVACGEVSLLGELRPVRGLERRLREAARLGFREAIVPAGDGVPSGDRAGSRVTARSRTLREALERALLSGPGTSGEG